MASQPQKIFIIFFQWAFQSLSITEQKESTLSWLWSSWVQVWRTCSTFATGSSRSKLSSYWLIKW